MKNNEEKKVLRYSLSYKKGKITKMPCVFFVCICELHWTWKKPKVHSLLHCKHSEFQKVNIKNYHPAKKFLDYGILGLLIFCGTFLFLPRTGSKNWHSESLYHLKRTEETGGCCCPIWMKERHCILVFLEWWPLNYIYLCITIYIYIYV